MFPRLRLLTPFLLIAVASRASAAEDARVAILVRQLTTSKDVRVRAQTVLLLGQTGSEAAVAPLCAILNKDPDPVVRSVSANALGDLPLPSAEACLAARVGERDPMVMSVLERAKAQAAISRGALYVSLAPVEDKVGGLSPPLLELADHTLRDKLASMKVVLAPPTEDRRQAASIVRARSLRGYQLRLQLSPGATDRGLKVELLVMTYPEQSLKGSWNVKAGGGKPESLIKLMVPRVLDDAATDLEWNP